MVTKTYLPTYLWDTSDTSDSSNSSDSHKSSDNSDISDISDSTNSSDQKKFTIYIFFFTIFFTNLIY